MLPAARQPARLVLLVATRTACSVPAHALAPYTAVWKDACMPAFTGHMQKARQTGWMPVAIQAGDRQPRGASLFSLTPGSTAVRRMFCQATGFGGTVQQGRTVEAKLRERDARRDEALEAAAAAREVRPYPAPEAAQGSGA